MSDELYALDLDTDLLWHLARPESVAVLLAEKVRDELVEDDYVAKVFNWQVAHTREHGVPATGAVLEDEFEDVNIEDPETAIEDLIARLRGRYLHNQGRQSLLDLKERYKQEPGQLAEAMAVEGRRLLDLTARRGTEFDVGDQDRALDLYRLRKERGRGPSFGFKALDEHFWGQEGLTFTIGSPKTYKTWLGTQAALNNVMQGKCVWHFPLELPAEQQDMRLRCLAANVPFWKYLRGQLGFDDERLIRDASEHLAGLGTYVVSKPPSGQRDFDTMFNNAADRGADLIIVDQLQYVEIDRGKDRGHASLGEGDTGWYWRALERARELSEQVPIQILHQFNRTAMFAEEMPSMQQAKASAAIEETATLVLGLWANKDMRHSNKVEYGTLASRNYGTPSWQLKIELSRGCDFEVEGRTDLSE